VPESREPAPRALRRPLLGLAVVALVLALAGLANHELWTPDEPRDAGVGREMWETGSRAVPRLSGQPFLEKPPLYWWAEGAVFQAAGRTSAGLARLPSALFGFATLLLTYALGRRFFSRAACLCGGLALLTTYGFLRPVHWVIVDPALVFGTTGALACLVHAEARRGLPRAALLAGFYGFLAAAFFAKGVVGLGLPALAALGWALWTGRRRALLGWHVLAGVPAVAGLAALWLWRVWAGAGEAGLRAFLVDNQLGRFLPSVAIARYAGGHQRPWLYYLLQLPLELLPWTPLVPLAAVAAGRRGARLSERERDGIRLVVCATLPAFILLSLAGTKRGLYLLPLLPPVALLLGWWMAAAPPAPPLEERLARLGRAFALTAAAALSVAAAAIDRSAWPAAAIGAATFALAFWVSGRRPPPSPAVGWLRVLALVSLGWWLGLVAALPPLDAMRSLRPALEEVNRQVPADAPLDLFAPSETTRGLVAFYTGRIPRIVRKRAALRELAEASSPSFVLIEGRRGRGAFRELRDDGVAFRLLASGTSSSGRELYLVALGGDEARAR
jgi:4-amino-4-deoxy-L-arabinose transferase-like glycosyltransferase